MTVTILCACILAFVVSVLSGKYLVPWLINHEATQPLKEEVEEKIYMDSDSDTE